MQRQFSQSKEQVVFDPEWQQQGVELWVKRDDLIDPVISGNKWRKLKYLLSYILEQNYATIISMGGPFSNHLHALSYACHVLGIQCKAFVRGERPADLNPTLIDMQNWGAQLEFVNRSEFRQLRKLKNSKDFPGLKPSEFWLPEGGATTWAMIGAGEIIDELAQSYDYICLPCGTGTTLAGLVSRVSCESKVKGFVAFKGGQYLYQEIEDFLPDQLSHLPEWTLELNYHFGGFARSCPELKQFMNDFVQQHGIEIEPVYSAKMFYGLFDLLKKNVFKPGEKILAIHTGGLQGYRMQ